MSASTSTTSITPPTGTHLSVGESHQIIETEHDGRALEWVVRSTEAEREIDRVAGTLFAEFHYQLASIELPSSQMNQVKRTHHKSLCT